jgi:uracil-DNA glycosylase family 4
MPWDDRSFRLKKPDSCRTCKFWEVSHSTSRKPYFETITGEGFCEPEGYAHLGVAFVAEASGAHEEEQGYPLRPNAQAGSMHTRALRSLHVSREQVYTTNILACRPPNNRLDGESYEKAVIDHCAPIRNERLLGFRESVKANPNVRQSVVVALGDTSFSTLTQYTGKYKTISYARGYPVNTVGYGTVLGTWHPAYVRRNAKLLGVLSHDYARAFEIAKYGHVELPRRYFKYVTESELRDLEQRVLALREDQYLVVDFETDDIDKTAPKGVWPKLQSVQFSMEPGTGYFIDITRDTSPVIKRMLASKCRKATHNGWDFDVPLAAHWDMPMGGIVDDTLWMFHHYQPDLLIEDAGIEADTDFRFSTSASLQSVASFYGHDVMWKHYRGSDEQEDVRFYGIMDVDATARIVMMGWPEREGVIRPFGAGSLPEHLKRLGLWNSYERYVRQYLPILQKAAERGIPINRIKQRGFDSELAAIEIEIDRKIQQIHPDELKRLDPINGFKNGPKEGPKVRRIGALVEVEPTQDYPGKAGYSKVTEAWEWLDEDAEDITPDEVHEMTKEGTFDAPVLGVWRKMVQREFHDQETKTKENCACLHVPEPGSKKRGLKAFGGTHRPDDGCAACGGKGVISGTKRESVVRWARLLPFRPSNKQFTKYIEFRGHKVPYDRKAKKKTTAAKGIEELAKKHGDPLYQNVLDIRTVEKIRQTYVLGKWVDRQYEQIGTVTGTEEPVMKLLPVNWDKQTPRIHTTFSLAPATGQTSSKRPNVQNGPKHTRNKNLQPYNLPKRWRSLIEARPGHRIWEFDLKSAHALTMGRNARDAQYMRLARMDLHSYVTSILASQQGLWPAPINLNVSDSDLKAALKEVRNYRYKCTCHPDTVKKGMVDGFCNGIHFEADIRDVKAKPAGLGIQFGMMGRKLWETNKESFRDEIEGQQVINTIWEAFPLIKKCGDDTLVEAHNNHFLISSGGFIRWFWHIWDYVYNPEGAIVDRNGHGSDAEDARAFRPANDAFVYIRDAQLRLEDLCVNEEAGFINTIHDSNMYETPDERPVVLWTPGKIWCNLPRKAEEMAFIIKTEMERPQMLLADPEVAPEGLWIGCDVKTGPDWANMKEVKL